MILNIEKIYTGGGFHNTSYVHDVKRRAHPKLGESRAHPKLGENAKS
jgi:hypothetical protein